MKIIKTPRGTFKVREEFTSEMQANEKGFYYYFTNDDGTDIYTKHIEQHSVHFAIVERRRYMEYEEESLFGRG